MASTFLVSFFARSTRDNLPRMNALPSLLPSLNAFSNSLTMFPLGSSSDIIRSGLWIISSTLSSVKRLGSNSPFQVCPKYCFKCRICTFSRLRVWSSAREMAHFQKKSSVILKCCWKIQQFSNFETHPCNTKENLHLWWAGDNRNFHPQFLTLCLCFGQYHWHRWLCPLNWHHEKFLPDFCQ